MFVVLDFTQKLKQRNCYFSFMQAGHATRFLGNSSQEHILERRYTESKQQMHKIRGSRQLPGTLICRI
jgi:hypothetical protein